MAGILVMLHLVHCSQSLLICEDLDTAKLSFPSPVECQAVLTDLVAALTGRSADYPVVMGRCRFIAAR